MKNHIIIRKVIGFIAMFFGMFAACSLDSDIPLWGTFLLIVVFFIGVFGGGYLLAKGEPIQDID